MNRLDELRKQSYKIQREITELLEAERMENGKHLIGRYFKFINSYSMPQTPEDYWWLYAHVYKQENSNLISYEFEKDSDGKVRINPDKITLAPVLETWVEITEDEFREAFNKLMNELKI
jgi:hypothetical protein